MGLKLSPLKTSFLAAIHVWTEIANTHPNKCKHPPTPNFWWLKSSFDTDSGGQLDRWACNFLDLSKHLK